MKLSILDQAPISAGKTAQEALTASVNLARSGEKFGYTRYWIAEHHDIGGLACPNPEVMLGIIGAQTDSIRIGAGAVLLPHYKAYRVAETYNLLATLFPGRIDLGIGRAPGGSAEATMALSDNYLEKVREYPDLLDELSQFLNQSFPRAHMFSKIVASPVPETAPQPWLLGTSEKSAILAAEKGMPYTFGQFMSKEDGPKIIRNYKEKFVQIHPAKTPKVIATISVICADTTEEAENLALSNQFWKVLQDKGEGNDGVPSVEEAKAYSFSDKEKNKMERMKQRMVIGNPKEVAEQLFDLQKQYDVDEFMMVTITHSYEARKKSYELVANKILDG